MSDKVIATLIGSIALILAVFLNNHFSPYSSCVRSLTGTQVIGGNGMYSNALAARVCAGRLGGGGND